MLLSYLLKVSSWLYFVIKCARWCVVNFQNKTLVVCWHCFLVGLSNLKPCFFNVSNEVFLKSSIDFIWPASLIVFYEYIWCQVIFFLLATKLSALKACYFIHQIFRLVSSSFFYVFILSFFIIKGIIYLLCWNAGSCSISELKQYWI